MLDRVGKTYPNGVRALDGISLKSSRARSSRSSAARAAASPRCCALVSGLDPADAGRVVLDGEAITAPHEKIGIIFQEPRLLPWLTVADNVGFGLERPCRRPSATSASRPRSIASASPTRRASGRANFRRTGAARRDRARAGDAAGSAAARRAVLGARCLHARRPAGSPARSVGRYRSRRWSWSRMTSRRRSCLPTAFW